MTRYTLHIPLQDNDGTERPDVLEDVRAELRLAGYIGWTEVQAAGYWAPTSSHEPILLFMIDVDEPHFGGRQHLTALSNIARSVKQTMEQDAVYLTRQHIDTELI